MEALDCHYVQDNNDNFYIVKGYWHEKNVYGCKVFSPNEKGDRLSKINGEKYEKVILNSLKPGKITNIKKIFDPREKTKLALEELKESVWGKFIEVFLISGVKIYDVGIIGSYLLGFDVKKDVDFVIYGKENCVKIKQNIKFIKNYLNATSITGEHINYQIKKYNGQFSKKNSFDKMLANKWSSIQISPGILSTIRFVYKKGEIPENYFDKKIDGKVKILGKVTDDFGTNFCPRSFKMKNRDKEYTVATYFWIYQSCVKNGDFVEVYGNLREGDVVTLYDFDDWIKIKS